MMKMLTSTCMLKTLQFLEPLPFTESQTKCSPCSDLIMNVDGTHRS